MRQVLVERWQADPDQAELLAHLSGGRLGWAEVALSDESTLDSRVRRLDDLEELIKATLVERFRKSKLLG